MAKFGSPKLNFYQPYIYVQVYIWWVETYNIYIQIYKFGGLYRGKFGKLAEQKSN